MLDILKDIPWRNHAPGLIFLTVAFMLLGLAVTFHLHQRDTLEQANVRYQAQVSTNRRASSAADELAQYMPAYLAWRAQGFIGEPQRLQWIETLQAVGNELQIPRVEFTLQSTQRPDPSDSRYQQVTLPLLLTPMHLNLDLLHEGDIQQLFHQLRRQANGLFSIERCDIERQQLAMLGECWLTWYSLADLTADWADYEAMP